MRLNMQIDLKDSIIIDLSRKWPKGPPSGKKPELKMAEVIDPQTRVRVMEPVSINDDGYGWSNITIHETGFYSYYDLQWYMEKDFCIDLSKRSAKFKAARVWRRVYQSSLRVKKEGIKGIYEVRSSYDRLGSLGHIWAQDKQSAHLLAKTMLGYLADDIAHIRVIPKRRAPKNELFEENKEIIEKLNSILEQNNKTVGIRELENEKIKRSLEAIYIMEEHFKNEK